MPRILLLIFFNFFGLSLFAQKVSPSLKIEANDVLIGDQVKTTVSVEIEQGKNVSFPKLSEYWKSENVEILNLSDIEKSNSNEGKQILKQTLTLVFWDTGKYMLPALPFGYISGESSDTVFSEKLNVKVRYPDGIVGDSTYMAPIKSILDEQKNFWDYLIDYKNVIYTFIFLLVASTLIYLIIKRIKGNRNRNAFLSPEEKALKALNRLLEADYSKKGQHAFYHEGVSLIVRTYLYEKYELKALESTTGQILDDISDVEIPAQLKSEMRELLETADLVKYAKASPLPVADKFAADYIVKLVNAARNKPTENNTNL
jgi:hypothetical protein